MDGQASTAGPAAITGHGRFLGESGPYRRLLTRDALQLVATLGLYRFWVSTDVRQYLWSRTELAGEQLDYTGQPIELLVGFLVLVVVLGPVLAVLSLLSIIPGLTISLVSAYLPAVPLVPLAILAMYQARRYRVNHTVYRGLRFHQTGSAWVYAILTTFWLVINVASLGLTYPWARVSLERYKMRHTFYGDVQGGFTGAGWPLFKIGLLLWLVMLVPLLLLFGTFIGEAIGKTEAEIQRLVVRYDLMILAWLLVAGLVIYPFFHAKVLRWRIAGMRFGTLSFRSDFSTWAMYKAYLEFYGLVLLIGIAVTAIAALVQLKIIPALPLGRSIAIEFIGVVLLAVAYFAVATMVALAYQATVRLVTWRLVVDALVIEGLDQIDRAKAHPRYAARRSGRIGAAINIGGF